MITTRENKSKPWTDIPLIKKRQTIIERAYFLQHQLDIIIKKENTERHLADIVTATLRIMCVRETLEGTQGF